MSRSLKNTLWASGANAAQQVIAFLAVIITARFVSPSDFGTVAVIMVFVLVAQRIMVESVGYYLMNETTLSGRILDAAFVVSILIGIASSILICGATVFMMASNTENTLLLPVLALAIVPVFDSISNVQFALFRRNGNFRDIAARTFFANCASAAFAVFLAYQGYGIWALVAQQVVLSFVGSAVLFFRSDWQPRLNFAAPEIKRIGRYCFPMSGSAVMNVVSNRADLLFAGALLGSQGAGLYSVAKRLVRTVIDTLVSGAMHVVLSDLNKRRVAGEALGELFLSRLRYGAMATFPLFGVLSILSGDIVLLLLGENWKAAGAALKVLACIGPLQFIYLLSSNVLISHSLAGRMIGINLLSLLALAGAVSLLALRGEVPLVGITVAVVFQSALVCTLAFLQAKKIVCFTARGAMVSLLPALLMLVMICSSLTAADAFISRGQDVIPRLIIDVVVALITYLLAIPIFLKNETRMIFRLLSPRHRS